MQYADATNLNARVRLHQKFSVNATGFVNWLFDQLIVPEGAVILEVGGGLAGSGESISIGRQLRGGSS